MLKRLFACVAAASLIGGGPLTARADESQADGPTLECSLVGLRIVTDDVDAARLVCHVTGASSADIRFSVSLQPQPGQASQRPICGDGLADGAGTCLGPFVDPASEPFSVTATLQPSGTTLGPVSVGGPGGAGQPAAPATPPMQFYPLPEQD